MMVPSDARPTKPPGSQPATEGTHSELRKKVRLARLLENLTQSLSPCFPELIPPAAGIATKLRDNTFNLVVVGQFKRGKSTLVNALIGDDILPTAVVPLTSIVTMVRYGAEEKVTVGFRGDKREIISRRNLPDFVTEKFNPRNVKEVQSVDIELPCEFLKCGINLVDTPGVGSIYAHNTDAANHFLPESDAIIFLMTADQPLSIGEVEFIRNVRDHVTKIFFVLNKVDMLSEPERKEAADFIVDSISHEMSVPKEGIRLFLVSSKTALKGKLTKNASLEVQSNIKYLEQSLACFLETEKTDVAVSAAARRARRIAVEASALAELSLKAYSESTESLQNKIDDFHRFRREVERRREDISRMIYTAYNIVETVEEDRVLFENKTQPELERRFDDIAAEIGTIGAPDLIGRLDTAIVKLVTEVVDKWRSEEESKIRERFNEAVRDLFGRMNELIDEVYRHAAEILNVEFRRMEDYPLFNDDSEFYYFILEDVKPSLEELTDAIVRRLPGNIAKHLIIRKRKETLKMEFDRQCGRVRYDIVQRIDKSMLKLGSSFSESVNGHLALIEKIIRDAMEVREKNESDASQKVQQYEAAVKKMSHLQNELADFE